jgi:ribonucleoside-diphosphate reductase alpha chain
MKFLKADGSFDVKNFVKVTELVITSMDISICFADFPTQAITQTTKDFRQLGIGYANLGALLMASGLAYDSEGGRALAGAITSVLTGVSYRRSAELAGIVGAYNGYARNAAAHTKVMRKHQNATESAKSVSTLDKDVWAEAIKQWASGNALGEKNGWRNAQASVLAPTGTIGLMMDCDTTGIEPDLALVKFKKMVGGGSMQIVNQTVPLALKKLGYTDETIEAIVEYISEHGNIIDAPGLKPEHYTVFDCAMGIRSISAMGHVHMMAACQPFLSGAISKTVNLPADASVEEIEEVYYQGWKLGIKALAVYRDNCKVGQPLSDSKGKKAEIVVDNAPTAVRRRLPKSRPAQTTSFSVAGAEGYMTAGAYADGALAEVFLKLGKQGSTLAGVMDAFSIAVSVGLQYGVPLETYVEKFANQRFEPAGMTDDADIRMAQSVMDYIFRRLALDYLPFDASAALGIYSAAERARALETGDYTPDEKESIAQMVKNSQSVKIEKAPFDNSPVGSSMELFEKMAGVKSDAPLCMTCGVKMRMAGSCFVCEGCGNTSGCS